MLVVCQCLSQLQTIQPVIVVKVVELEVVILELLVGHLIRALPVHNVGQIIQDVAKKHEEIYWSVPVMLGT